MKKLIFLTISIFVPILSFTQTKDVKTYSGTIPKVVDINGNKYETNKETWSSIQIWTINTDNKTYTLHNGILVTSPEVKSYADGQLTLEQLETQGYIEIKSDDYIAYEFQGIGMLNFSIDKIMNDDNISILCDRTNAPFYSYPRVFKRSKVMDDGMFESFLNETKVRPTKDQDLANNPYGIERWEFAEVFDTYS